MLRSRTLNFAFFLLALLLVSCGSNKSSDSSARIRVVNAIPGTTISVTLDSDVLASSVGFEQASGYQSINSGTREFKVSANGGGTNVIDVSINVISGTDYTYVVYGPLSAATAQLLSDAFAAPNTGQFLVRVSNLAPGIGPIDAYLTTPGADISVTSPTIAGVAYGATNTFLTLNVGSYELRITPANSKEVVFDTAARTFSDKSANEAIVYGKGSGRLANVMLLDNNGNVAVADNLLAEFKVINASQVSAPLNFFVDGTLALSNVPAAGVSAYQKVTAGTRTITVESTATPGATLLTTTPSLASGTDTSIAIVGSAGALTAIVLPDNNVLSTTGRARVRVVNASPNLGAVDVFVNFSKQITGLATGTASAYFELTADATGTNYEFDFNLTGTTNPSLMLPATPLLGGKTYTIYLIGPATALRGVVSKDT